MAYVPPKRMKEVSEDIDRIFNASNSKDARIIIEVMDKYEEDIPDVTRMLDEGRRTFLPFTYFQRNTGKDSGAPT